MTEEEEDASESAGRRAAYLDVALTALGRSGMSDPADRLANALSEVLEARIILKELFKDLEIEWPGDDLHLADVIDKHLARNITEAKE